jgi:hypothetical protein
VTLRSVLDIQVNDDAFKKHHEAFAKYREALDKLPPKWKEVGGVVRGVSGDMEDLAALMLAQNEHLVALLRGQRAFGQATQNSAHHMGILERSARGVMHSIGTATRDLLKWGTISAVAGGLLGLGGLFGIEGLATSAYGMRKQASGLGLPAGLPELFGIEFGPSLNNPEQLLQGMLTARTDMSSPQYRAMMMLGLRGNKDPAAVAAGIAGWARRTPEQLLGPLGEAFGITSMADIGTLERLHSGDPREVADETQRLRRMFALTRVSDDLLKKWQNLDITLGEARVQIRNSLIVGLADLAPSIGKLSAAFSDVVSAFLKSPVVKHWIDDVIVPALESFAKYIGTDKFKNDVQYVAGVLWNFATVVWDVIKYISNLLPGVGGSGSGAGTGAAIGGALGAGIGTFVVPGLGTVGGGILGGALGAWVGSWIGGSSGSAGANKNIGEVTSTLRAKGWSDAAITAALAAAKGEGGFETSWQKSKVDPSSYGMWQFNFQGGEGVGYAKWLNDRRWLDPKAASTQAQYLAYRMEQLYPGFSKITDPVQATHIMEQYFERHKGPLGLYDRNIPGASQKLGMNSGGVRIVVENRTGGSAHVSASMLGQVA